MTAPIVTSFRIITKCQMGEIPISMELKSRSLTLEILKFIEKTFVRLREKEIKSNHPRNSRNTFTSPRNESHVMRRWKDLSRAYGILSRGFRSCPSWALIYGLFKEILHRILHINWATFSLCRESFFMVAQLVINWPMFWHVLKCIRSLLVVRDLLASRPGFQRLLIGLMWSRNG